MEKNYTADTFRRWGYLQAQLDPFGRIPPFPHSELENIEQKEAEKWREIYCGPIGAEFMHMPYPERCKWIADHLEEAPEEIDRKFYLSRILSSELFESYIHTRYIGTKRFSLEGLSVIIPALDSILERAGELGYEVAMIGMAHRGRLNAMHHIAGALASNLFAEFEDVDPRSVLGGGDVKYHKGATGTYKTQSGKEIFVHFPSNPSHLEAVNPVLNGRAKAKQHRAEDKDGKKILLILLHGDAAFAGQGIAAETLNFAELPGFKIGGTVHIIVNNLIGFTAVPEALHSSRFASDIAKRLPVPIFHVNAEKPDAVVRTCSIAMKYRHEFSSDVVVDVIGYRRFGHSEVDDPTATSPKLYDQISDHPQLYKSYAKEIGVDEKELGKMEKETMDRFAEEHEKGKAITTHPKFYTLPEYWESFVGGPYDPQYEVDTSISKEEVAELGELACTTPEKFNVHPKVAKLLEQRKEMAKGDRPIDWGMAETLAFASLVKQGLPVRVTGQDSRRGTFNHRHAALYDNKTRELHIPLCNISENQGRFSVYDSMLSEAAAVGFEYGYSRDYPEALVCWEAQFGDFANGAQIIVDQFISAAEDKWGLLSGLVMLLPHGYEGQGPEHSSARLERYLQLAGEDNMQVCYPSTAAQQFHLLRRQALRKWRKPLIVMTPKSMLRAKPATSSVEELVSGKFQTVYADDSKYTGAERLFFCTGKIVHQLRAERERLNADDTAIISIEQLYPFPEGEVAEVIENYPNLKNIFWIQEEPANMGALSFVKPQLERLSGGMKVTTIKRATSASPATGSLKAHTLEQQALLKFAFPNYN